VAVEWKAKWEGSMSEYLHGRCLLLAHSGHPSALSQCPLLGHRSDMAECLLLTQSGHWQSFVIGRDFDPPQIKAFLGRIKLK